MTDDFLKRSHRRSLCVEKVPGLLSPARVVSSGNWFLVLGCCSAKHEALNMTNLQPSTVETESEEYRSHNNTESDIEVPEKGLVVIEDVNTVRSTEM